MCSEVDQGSSYVELLDSSPNDKTKDTVSSNSRQAFAAGPLTDQGSGRAQQ